MTAPTKQTRTDTYFRDGYRCVMCGAVSPLEFGHRRAVGAGGSKILPPPVDGITQCSTCNAACEAELQGKALANGWKVRRWVNAPERVPMFYPLEFQWYRLEGTRRVRISSAVAIEMGCSVYGDEWMQWRMEVIRGGR
jgi:hypothetical protein